MTAAPTARGPYRNGIRRREQIVAKASEVFGELGYVGGSLRTIAERVGVAPASLMQHFGSKEGLLEAVLEDWTRRQTSGWPGAGELHGLAAFEWFRGLTRFHVQNRGLLELFITMAAEATHVAHPAHEFIRSRYASGLAIQEAALREARDAGEIGPLTDEEIEAEASMFFAVLDGLELQWLLNSDIDLIGRVDRYLDTALARWRSAAPNTRSTSQPDPDCRRC